MMAKVKAFLKAKGNHAHYSFYSKSLLKCDKNESFGKDIFVSAPRIRR